MRRTARLVLSVAAGGVSVVAVAAPASAVAAPASVAAAPAVLAGHGGSVRHADTSLPSAASRVRTLLVEPESGLAKIYASIEGAKKSIDLEMYELVDSRAESLLARAAARGVDVRVILDHHLEGTRNAAARGYLTSRGVSVTWAPPAFYADHEKAMVVDTDEAWIMTLNLTSQFYPNTRDFAVLDTTPADV
ncbi:MAG: phospholipase D-like domain-containing protein, partial [Acidimicrobiales bacterium]